MTKVALVFRTIGERTSDLALELAKEHIRPDEVHVLSNERPFTEAVRKMLAIDFDADFVVAVDADSLIFEDMRPWLEKNRQAYVDCYVHDRFRGRIHCGVHVTRIDVVREMRRVDPPLDDEAYVLRPESRLRKLALNRLGYTKSFKSFRIFHDHFQHLRDVWAKYALRELRSRTAEQRRKLDAALARWAGDEGEESRVATAAVRWAQRELPEGTPTDVLSDAIARLPDFGAEQVAALGLEERGPLSRAEAEAFVQAHEARWPERADTFPVFGLGLSRTGTRSLTAALHVLGIDTVHYPIDDDTFRALSSGALDFQLLEAFDGITDITVAPYYAQLDRMHPDARFVLTVREEEGWLKSCRNHWTGRDPFAPTETPAAETHMKIRRFLRAATYGTYAFEPERFRYVYRKHVEDVRRHFAGRPGKLLELNVVGGDGWEQLCRFVDRPVPRQPFPHKGGALSARIAAEVGDPDD
ncbi:MAG TPA: sulfotransferase [Sandaracinaceae bacterium LLY-WYZ-13_1]|nr:sulfotransferase [Sandaracinaceae bacterium LLY-WYZ-13_1]